MLPLIKTCAQSGGGGGKRRSNSTGAGYKRFCRPGGSVPLRTNCFSSPGGRRSFLARPGGRWLSLSEYQPRMACEVGAPDDLIKLWLGHSQNLIDLYAAQLRYDETYRREWCEKAGLGFELGELGYKSMAPIRPSLVA